MFFSLKLICVGATLIKCEGTGLISVTLGLMSVTLGVLFIEKQRDSKNYLPRVIKYISRDFDPVVIVTVRRHFIIRMVWFINCTRHAELYKRNLVIEESPYPSVLFLFLFMV